MENMAILGGREAKASSGSRRLSLPLLSLRMTGGNLVFGVLFGAGSPKQTRGWQNIIATSEART